MRYRVERRQALSSRRPSDFADTPRGSTEIILVESPDIFDWGAIPAFLAPFPHSGTVDSGTIVVPEGNRSFGYLHVVGKHEHNIARLHGGMTVPAYLADVLRHHQRIYQQPDGSLWLIRENGIRKCAVVAPLILDGTPAYMLVTAYPLPREPDFTRRGAIKLRYVE